MTTEQKARVITELVQSRQQAAEMIEHHDREAIRYRLQYKNLGDQITAMFQDRQDGHEVFIEVPRRHGKNTLRRLLTDFITTGKLNK